MHIEINTPECNRASSIFLMSKNEMILSGTMFESIDQMQKTSIESSTISQYLDTNVGRVILLNYFGIYGETPKEFIRNSNKIRKYIGKYEASETEEDDISKELIDSINYQKALNYISSKLTKSFTVLVSVIEDSQANELVKSHKVKEICRIKTICVSKKMIIYKML